MNQRQRDGHRARDERHLGPGRGQVNFVMGLVLMVVALLLAVVIFIKVRDIMTTGEDSIDCASQIQTHAYLVSATGESFTPSIVCPTKRVSVSAKTEDDADQVIAQEMQRCWKTWGENKLQLFGDKEGIYCHICSTIDVTGVDKITGLPKYLDDNKANKDQSFTQYFQGTKSGTYFDDTQFQQAAGTYLPTDKPIGVIFFYAKGYHWYDVLRNKVTGTPAVGATAGLLTGGAAGYGFLAIGAAVGLTVTWPVAIVVVFTGAVAGSALGTVGSMVSHAEASHMGVIYVRPLTGDDIKFLGCQYAPAKNQ